MKTVPARILVVEDNPANLDLMTYLLKSFGHTVLTQGDGAGVLELMRKEQPDLVICDIQLPTVDGYEVARQLKADAVLSQIPLIAVTAYAMVGDRDKLLSLGFDAYISKPIDPETFVQGVQRFLRPEQRAAEPVPQSHAAELPREKRPVPTDKVDVLVVDDSPVNLDLMRTLLEPAGYVVRTASGVQEALILARLCMPDLVITDLHMACGGGAELARAMSRDAELRSIPCIVITSTGRDTGQRAESLAAGANLFIVRPIEPEQLLQEIERCALTRKD